MTDLNALASACPAFGIEARPFGFGVGIYLFDGVKTLEWDGESEDGRVAFLFRDAVLKHADKFICGEIDFDPWGWLWSPLKDLTAASAAQCLIDMHSALHKAGMAPGETA